MARKFTSKRIQRIQKVEDDFLPTLRRLAEKAVVRQVILTLKLSKDIEQALLLALDKV